MQFYKDRLYIVTTSGDLTCIDASEAAIEAAKKGKIPKARKIVAPKESEALLVTSTVETTSDASSGVLIECYKQGSKLRVRVLSEGYDKTWNVQFPKNLREDKARFVVDEVRTSSRGGFYRAYGTIKRLN